jgi:hypothetical protein
MRQFAVRRVKITSRPEARPNESFVEQKLEPKTAEAHKESGFGTR